MKKKRRKTYKTKRQKKQHFRRHKRQHKVNNPKMVLRQGSKEVKQTLLRINPRCDICGYKGELQLHHVYLIRHGFKTQLEHCVLLCDKCHKKFHKKFDKYLDKLYLENPQTDFFNTYQNLKTFL